MAERGKNTAWDGQQQRPCAALSVIRANFTHARRRAVLRACHANPGIRGREGSGQPPCRLKGMALESIIGQDRVRTSLQRTLSSGRIAHAYLFHGPDGCGKAAAALAFARILQCEQPTGGDACGRCASCQKAARGMHPDIHVLMPVTKDTDDEERGRRIQLLYEDPYQPADLQSLPSLDGKSGSSNKQIIYSRDNVQQWLHRPMSYHRVEGQYRVAILLSADKMLEKGANAFLKLLEEPGERTVFLLLTDRVDHLLPTILSRCQQIRFDPLERSDIEQAMLTRGATPALAAMLARMSGGSLRRAIALAGDEDMMAVRDDVMEFLRKSYQGKGDSVVSLADRMARPGREAVKFQLDLLLGVLRDMLLMQQSGDADLVVNIDQIEALQKFASNLPDARLDLMIRSVEQTMGLVERNVNVRLALVTLSRSLMAGMLGRPDAVPSLDLASG